MRLDIPADLFVRRTVAGLLLVRRLSPLPLIGKVAKMTVSINDQGMENRGYEQSTPL